jgi:hypothetical protein
LEVTINHLKDVADLVLTHRTATKPFEEPYLDHSLLNKKISEIEQILEYSKPLEKPNPAPEKNKERGTESVAGISVTDEGEIFGVGKFYSERSWEKFRVKKK